MGRAGAIRFAKEGAAVAVVDIDADGVARGVEEITGAGGTAIGLTGDLTDDDFSRAIVHDTAKAFGGLDFAWMHAGHPGPARVEGMDMEIWDLGVDLNLRTIAITTGEALPEMRKRGYSDSLSTGVLAAGGTLGILIPPSIILVIYAIMAEQNIVKMFMAALIPGLLAALGYILTVAIYVRLRPDAADTAERVPMRARIRTLAATWPVIAIFGLTMGGIVGDWNWARPGPQALFTPNEAAAFGAFATGLYGVLTRRLTWRGFVEAILETAKATGMIFFIILGVLYAMYGGIATPSETAAVGALLCLVIAVVIYRMWHPRALWVVLRDSTRESVMILFIIAAAGVFSYMLSSLFITQSIAEWIGTLDVNRWVLMGAINVFLIIAGFFLPPVAVILM